MKKSPKHLQTDEPTMEWEEWYLELATLVAKALNIDKIAATRHIKVEEAQAWYKDGFTPFCTFRENFCDLTDHF